MTTIITDSHKKRIYGCFFGQLVGDALGTRYEFGSSLDTKRKVDSDIKNNFLEILGGGPFNLGVGQVTDDSELALGLARTLSKHKKYNKEEVAKQYIFWFNSDPFDIGISTKKAFHMAKNYKNIVDNSKKYNNNSLSNGCLMRISPLAIHGIKISNKQLEIDVKNDCVMTNPNKITVDATTVFVFAIKEAIKTGDKNKIYNIAVKKAKTQVVKNLLRSAKIKAYPVDINGKMKNADSKYQGYFGFAFQNAFYHLLNGTNFYQSLLDTILMGGDTDTNSCITASLLGAYYGIDEIPKKWIKSIINSKYEHNRLRKYPDVNTKDAMKLIVTFL